MRSSISTKELSARLFDPELVVVDVRPTAAYNGWKLQREARGGHIRGAVSFPLSWTEAVTAPDLVPLWRSKGITSSNSLVIYGYGPGESATMARILRCLGFRDVFTYDSGLPEWAADSSLPMARLANYEKLVHPQWIDQLISGGNPETYPGRGFVIFEVSPDEVGESNAGHVPGAVHLDTNAIEKGPLWNRVSDQELEKVLLAHGVSCDKTVVVYSKDTAAASRAASILMYAGVTDVRLLDGGFEAWIAAGYHVETEIHKPTPVQAFGRRIPAHPEYIVDSEQVRELLEEDEALLVSVRSWAEYVGEASGYSYTQKKGRIAGAVWGHSGRDPQNMQDYRNLDQTMRSYHEIASVWRDEGITPDRRVIFYCGTGWRASEAFFCAYLMGWRRISVYDGGWLEWSLDESSPIEVGIPVHPDRVPVQ
jgi:thiosulfate/3-mercaptopyruvate sulfurtransferase